MATYISIVSNSVAHQFTAMRLAIRFLSFWQILNCVGRIADGFQDKATPLNGQHVTVTGLETPIDFYVIRNSTGHISQLSGTAGEMLEWMKSYYNLTYSPLEVRSNIPWDSLGDKPGLVSYLLNGDCDILGSAVLTSSRTALVDFTLPMAYQAVSFMVPAPGSTLDVLAALKPFQLSAWMGTLAAIGTILVMIYFGSWYTTTKLRKKKGKQKLDKSKITFHVLAIPLGQADYCDIEKFLPNRIVIGAWGLSAFILVNYYTSLLTGYATAPNPQPLIKSIRDLRYRPDIRLVTEKDRNTDTLLSAATSGFLKRLGDRLRGDPQSRCPTSQQCVEMVKQGRSVYASAKEPFLIKAMKEDYESTGKCNFELGKEDFLIMRISWTVRKQSPYLDYLNIGITRLQESGLLPLWLKQYSPDAHQCLQNMRKQPEVIAPLQLRSLTGAFVALLSGYFLSIMVLISERIRFHFSARRVS